MCRPNLDKSLTGIWIWIGDVSLAASVNGSLFWCRGHVWLRCICLIVLTVKGTCVCPCVFMCALRMSLLPPLREQAGHLAAMSQPVLLTDKLRCLSQWMIEQHVWMCVCVCVCVQPLQDIVNTQKQFLWEHNLILIFTVQVGKFPSFHPMEAICVHYRILLDTWNVLHMQSHIQYLRLIQVCFWLTVYSFRWDPDAKRCSNQYFYIIRKSDDDVRELLIVTGPLRIITQS